MTRDRVQNTLEQLFSIFDDYRHQHGKGVKEARICAIQEIIDGMDACYELQEIGDFNREDEVYSNQ